MDFSNHGIRIKKAVLIFTLVISAAGCNPLNAYRELVDTDFQPPLLKGAETISGNEFRLEFTEPVTPLADTFRITVAGTDNELPIVRHGSISPAGNYMAVETTDTLAPGTRGMLEGQVEDRGGNSLYFTIMLYGWNDDVPNLLITEFTTQGSAAHPDRVELAALSSGNTAGITFCDGINTDYRQRIILPPINVTAGEYILIHCGKETVTSGYESESTSESAAPHASPEAWDVWITDGSGLSGNNGVLTLYRSPRGKLMDAVAYSNRTADSDLNYRGFGSRALMLRMELLEMQQGWEPVGDNNEERSSVSPEDSVNPDPSTATRSMCRLLKEEEPNEEQEPGGTAFMDTDTKDDWYIVPTGKASFGSYNCPEVYAP